MRIEFGNRAKVWRGEDSERGEDITSNYDRLKYVSHQ